MLKYLKGSALMLQDNFELHQQGKWIDRSIEGQVDI